MAFSASDYTNDLQSKRVLGCNGVFVIQSMETTKTPFIVGKFQQQEIM
jgi:hypothetical protein